MLPVPGGRPAGPAVRHENGLRRSVRQVRAVGRRPGPPPSPAPSARPAARSPARRGGRHGDHSSQPPPLAGTWHGTASRRSPANTAWLDRDTGQQVIRVVHEPGETTLLYCLDPRQRLPVRGRFSPGTPDAVIIAAIGAALSPPRRGRPGPDQAGHGPAAHARREAVNRDDDR